MPIKQKLVIDKSKTNQFDIIVRDETGNYSPSNPDGYGGNNGSPVTQFERYIFDITNLNTGEKYRQIQSDDLNNPDEFYNPSIARIANKEDVHLNAENQEISSYSDGVYKIDMQLQLSPVFFGEGYINTDVIVNVPGAATIARTYDAIVVGNEIYGINSNEDSVLILDRDIVESFTSFKPILRTSETFILFDKLDACVSNKVSEILSNCVCDNLDDLNSSSELLLLNWGINRSIEKEDYTQAKEYLDLLYKLCSNLNCNCNNGC